MTITIIMPVYNDPQCERAIKSVIDQKYGDWHLQILDNGSTDEKTISAINKFEGQKGITVTRFPFNRQSECGALFAMQEVKTPLLAFLFSDDQWHPDFLKRMIDRILETGADAIFCNTSLVDEDGALWKKPPLTQYSGDITEMTPAQHLHKMFTEQNTLHPCAMVVNLPTYQRLGGFNPCLHRIGDMVFFARLLAESEVIFFKEKLAYITTNSICSGKKNLSFGNDKISMEMLVERQKFLFLFSSSAFLSKAMEIFKFSRDKMPEGETGRLFFLGMEAIKNPSLDYVFFGYSCIYRAVDMHYNDINDWCMENHHTSAGEFIKGLQNKGQRRAA